MSRDVRPRSETLSQPTLPNATEADDEAMYESGRFSAWQAGQTAKSLKLSVKWLVLQELDGAFVPLMNCFIRELGKIFVGTFLTVLPSGRFLFGRGHAKKYR